jgi:hypothetical protein
MRKSQIRKIIREVLQESVVNFNMLERELDKMFEKLDIDINFTRHFKERVLERGLTEEDILELAHKIIDNYGDKVADLPKDQNAVFSDLARLVDIAVVSGGYGEDYMKDIIFKTAYKRLNISEPKFRTNASSPVLAVTENFTTKK